MNNRVYSDVQIKKACSLRQKGVSRVQAAFMSGMQSSTPIRWHCEPEERLKLEKRQLRWRLKHPERVREICKKASQKYFERLRNS